MSLREWNFSIELFLIMYFPVFKVRHHIKCIYLQPPNRSMGKRMERRKRKEEEGEEGEKEEREQEDK